MIVQGTFAFAFSVLLVTVLALNLLGDGLRDSLDSRMQKVNQ